METQANLDNVNKDLEKVLREIDKMEEPKRRLAALQEQKLRLEDAKSKEQMKLKMAALLSCIRQAEGSRREALAKFDEAVQQILEPYSEILSLTDELESLKSEAQRFGVEMDKAFGNRQRVFADNFAGLGRDEFLATYQPFEAVGDFTRLCSDRAHLHDWFALPAVSQVRSRWSYLGVGQ